MAAVYFTKQGNICPWSDTGVGHSLCLQVEVHGEVMGFPVLLQVLLKTCSIYQDKCGPCRISGNTSGHLADTNLPV